MYLCAYSHDSFFKNYMCNKEAAKDFFKNHLPAELLEIVDLKTLQLRSDTFVDEDLKAQMADLLYSVNMNGKKGYFYLLTEHQSSPQKLMPFRILKYVIAIMDKHLKQGHKSLPLVYPIVFYHGKTSPYPYSISIYDNFADTERELAKKYLFKDFKLVDITLTKDEDILSHGCAAVMEMLQKHIHARDIYNHIKKLIHSRALHVIVQKDGQILEGVINYIIQQADSKSHKKILDEITISLENKSEEVMTILDRFVQDELRGVKGKIIRESMQQGKLEVASNLLKNNVPLETISKATGFPIAELKKIQ